MARSRSLARFASRCSGASPGTKPNLPTGILPLRASGIRGRPSPHPGAACDILRAAMPRTGPALELCGVNFAQSVMQQGFSGLTPHN